MTKASTAGGAVVGTEQLPSQDATTGGAVSHSYWTRENTTSGNPHLRRKGIHVFSQIQMNMYGVRNRSTEWSVRIVKVREEFADFFADGSNVSKQKLVDYLARPLIVSNLNLGDPITAKFIKVIKQYKVSIDPITTDQVGGDLAIPKIQTLRWFIKHNRLRSFDWNRLHSAADTGAAANYDTENIQQFGMNPQVPARVYLLITALAPSGRSSCSDNQTPAVDVTTEPTYDIVIRNKWLFNDNT